MARMDPALEARINQAPQQEQQVVITLAKGAEEQATSLGMAGTTEVAPGVFSGRFTGDQLLELSQQDDVEDITPDVEVRALRRP